MESSLFTSKKIIGVMAATPQGIIGKDNALPWNYPNELDYFRKVTKDHVVIMGQKTFQSTPPNLFIDRTPITLSQDPSFQSQIGETVRSLKECLTFINKLQESKKIFMIGGAKIAHLFLEANLLSSFILTKIHHSYPGDTYLNMRLFEGWRERIIASTLNYTIVHLYLERNL